MIDEEHYVFPHEEPKREQTEEERRRAADTLAYLEAMPWRPFDVEW